MWTRSIVNTLYDISGAKDNFKGTTITILKIITRI